MAEGTPVRLAVYDISGGWARVLSPILFCRRIKIAPHTGLLAYGREYFWAGGIQKLRHEEFEETRGLRACEVVDLGRTCIPEDLFNDFILNVSNRYTQQTCVRRQALGAPMDSTPPLVTTMATTMSPPSRRCRYDILGNNCNAFTQECAEFLCGSSIPDYITAAPQAVHSSPLGKCVATLLALAPSSRAAVLLLLQLLLALGGILSLLSMARPGGESACPAALGADSTLNFAFIIFVLDAMCARPPAPGTWLAPKSPQATLPARPIF